MAHDNVALQRSTTNGLGASRLGYQAARISLPVGLALERHVVGAEFYDRLPRCLSVTAAEVRANEIADRMAAAIWASRDTVTNRYLTPREAADLTQSFDGILTCEGPMYAGLQKHFSPTAVLRTGGIDVLVVTHNMQILDRMAFAAFSIEPRAKRVVALKSMQHFRAAFEPLAAEVVVCDSGAIARPRRAGLPFRKVRRPIHPLDPVTWT